MTLNHLNVFSYMLKVFGEPKESLRGGGGQFDRPPLVFTKIYKAKRG